MFRFKRFAIEQDRTSMKVGTDGVLLGAWVDLWGDEQRILDIGTGTGVVALMMAQRSDNERVVVDAVEIDLASAEQATENVEASIWSDRVAIFNCDIQSFRCTEVGGLYDLIVTNPPYFVDSLQSPDSGRTTARHTATLPFGELVDSAVRLLSREGRFALILPVAEMKLFDGEAVGKLQKLRCCDVFSRAELPVKRQMCEYVLQSDVPIQPRRETIVIESGRPPQFTEEYRTLTREFYLKF